MSDLLHLIHNITRVDMKVSTSAEILRGLGDTEKGYVTRLFDEFQDAIHESGLRHLEIAGL